MHILIHDYGGYPFPIDLSRELTFRGYQVDHIYTTASGNPKGDFPKKFYTMDIKMPPIQKSNFIQRWRQEKTYGLKVADVIRQRKPDIVISANTPLESQRLILNTCQRLNIPFMFWLQDIISGAMNSILHKKLGSLGTLVSHYYFKIEKQLLKNSEFIVVIDDNFKHILNEWQISTKKISVIRNWGPIDHIYPMSKNNEFAKQYQLIDKFVVLYSGTIGMKHDPAVISQAALNLRNEEDIKFVVVAEGPGMPLLKKEKKRLKLSNLKILPFQSFLSLPKVLATADVLLVLLEKNAAKYSVPSKVWTAYCAGRPSLLVMPKTNMASKITEQISAGIVLRPEQKQDLFQEILSLKNNPELAKKMGLNARHYAEEHFNIHRIADRFERIIIDLVKDKNIFCE